MTMPPAFSVGPVGRLPVTQFCEILTFETPNTPIPRPERAGSLSSAAHARVFRLNVLLRTASAMSRAMRVLAWLTPAP